MENGPGGGGGGLDHISVDNGGNPGNQIGMVAARSSNSTYVINGVAASDSGIRVICQRKAGE